MLVGHYLVQSQDFAQAKKKQGLMTLVKLLTLPGPDLMDYSHKIRTDMNMNVSSKCDKHHTSVVWPNSYVV